MILERVYGFLRLCIKSQAIPSSALKVSDIKLVGTLVGSIAKFAVPATLERLSTRLGQVIYFGLIVRMGTDTYVAHNIAGYFTSFASTVAGGCAVATSALIGQA